MLTDLGKKYVAPRVEKVPILTSAEKKKKVTLDYVPITEPLH